MQSWCHIQAYYKQAQGSDHGEGGGRSSSHINWFGMEHFCSSPNSASISVNIKRGSLFQPLFTFFGGIYNRGTFTYMALWVRVEGGGSYCETSLFKFARYSRSFKRRAITVTDYFGLTELKRCFLWYRLIPI